MLAAACGSRTARLSPADPCVSAIDCKGTVAHICEDGAAREENCATRGEVCIVDLGCRLCAPDTACCGDASAEPLRCGESGDPDILLCASDGRSLSRQESCDTTSGLVCATEPGEAQCLDACVQAALGRSSVGCEFYGVDLDNYAGLDGNAAAQQFAIVVVNLGDSRADVTVEINDVAAPDPAQPAVIRSFALDPGESRALDDLEPREVDGSPPGTFGEGNGTALTSSAFRIRSTRPLAAFQFNPYQRYDVFSNDASMLLPALGPGDHRFRHDGNGEFLVMGWPQLIADTDDPDTDATVDLPATLTIVGSAESTHVTVRTTAPTLGSPDVPAAAAGDTIEAVLGAFDVLNLESDGFGADFTGTWVLAEGPVSVFSGAECTEVPEYAHRDDRSCCCDHLEEQIAPASWLGGSFVAVQTPLRGQAMADAGADVMPLQRETEYWRLLSAVPTTCATSLPAPQTEVSLAAGIPETLAATQDFVIECGAPVALGQFVSGQQAILGGMNNDLPGGDPAFILVPSVEQFRKDVAAFVPAHYAFDYLLVAAPTSADVRLDGVAIEQFPGCQRSFVGQIAVGGPTDFDAIQCSLSQPIVNSGPPVTVDHAVQNDGVHVIRADEPVGVVVYGFDRFVSYGYPAGADAAPLPME
jgi:hypothetical protein